MVTVRHPDQLWWPDVGLRKQDAVAYYERIAPAMLPHLRDRPLTLKRHYNGPRSPFEWIKGAPPELPEWIPVSPQPAKSRGGAPVRYVVVDSVEALLWLVDFGCVDFHVWTARADRPDRPDHVLFDLDPAGVPLSDVVAAALLLREALDALGLESLVKTTGGEGLHVHVPIARRHTHEEAREFAQRVAAALVRASGGLVTGERSPSRRHGVFVDTKMNGHEQQVVCAYSLRPLPGAPVATPLRWDEVDEQLDPGRFTPPLVLERGRMPSTLGERVCPPHRSPPRRRTFLFELSHVGWTHQGAQSGSPAERRPKEQDMSEPEKTSQQQKDTRAQNDLTAKVGVKLSRPEKSTTSTWSRIKRLLRMG